MTVVSDNKSVSSNDSMKISNNTYVKLPITPTK